MPEILTKRLALLPYRYQEKLLLRIHTAWMNDPEVMKYSEHRHTDNTYWSCKRYIGTFDHQKSFLWAICGRGVKNHPSEPWEDHYIGHITAYRDKPNGIAEITMMIGEKQMWGKGYGTEAWAAVSDWLLAEGTRKLIAGTMEPNESMKKILVKTGFVEDGRRKDHFIFEGAPVDMIQYAKFK